tara:strand:- start:142 stop:546 length:405 start_codon:yes stop_codon:yes gene_type:complete
MKKLSVLIFLMMMSFQSFSQNVIDTTTIQLKKPIARLVIKDLIKGDGANEELVLNIQKISLLENKVSLKDSVIISLNEQVFNFDNILLTKNNQLTLSQELSKRLERDLKKQKFKTKLMGGAGILVAVAIAVLVK